MKLTIVLPDGTHQPIEVSEQATLRRLLPALAAKIVLPRRDEGGTAVAYYATHQNKPIPDDQTLASLGIGDDDMLILHPVVVPDPHEAIELEPEARPEPVLPRPLPPRRQRQRPSSLPRFLKVGCFLMLAVFCCIPVTLFSWLAYAIEREASPQTATAVPAAERVTFNEHEWDFAVIDAAYNATTDQLIMVSANPHRLHSYNPNTGQDVQIPLPRQPTAVTVQRDGRSALVSHSGLLSSINLETEQIQTIPFEANIHDVVLAADGWLYFTANSTHKDRIYGLKLETETTQEIILPNPNDTRSLELAPDGRSLYGTTDGTETGRLEKIDITRGTPQFMYDSGDKADTCGEVWLAEDGRFAFTGCGHIWRLADQRQNDMVLLGNFFPTPQQIIALAHSASTGGILLITEANDSQILVFDSDGSNLLATETLPEGAHGRYLFLNSHGSQYYAIVQTDEGQFGLVFGEL